MKRFSCLLALSGVFATFQSQAHAEQPTAFFVLGRDCDWANSTDVFETAGPYKVAYSVKTSHAGISIPTSFAGRECTVQYRFRVVQGAATVGFDDYGRALSATGGDLYKAGDGWVSVVLDGRLGTTPKAVICLKDHNTRVEIESIAVLVK